MNFSRNAECAFPLVRFLGEQVPPGWLSEGNLAGTGDLEGFLGPGMGFYLWHGK